MRFFKHFTDSHRGRFIQELTLEMGMAGVGCYWTLVELCAEKLEKLPHEEYTEAHCVFRFHERIVRQSLHLSSTNVAQMLNICQTLVALSWTRVGNEVEIKMPKLLEYMDRDSKRARTMRDMPAPKRKNKEKEKNIDIESGADAPEGSGIVLVLPEWAHTKLSNQSRHLIGKVKKQATIDSWLSKYSADFLIEEIAKASMWLDESGKQTKNIGNFLTGWFERSTNPLKTQPAKKKIDFKNVNWGPVT